MVVFVVLKRFSVRAPLIGKVFPVVITRGLLEPGLQRMREHNCHTTTAFEAYTPVTGSECAVPDSANQYIADF